MRCPPSEMIYLLPVWLQVVLHIEMAMRAAEYAIAATKGTANSSNPLASSRPGGEGSIGQCLDHHGGAGRTAGRQESREPGRQRWFTLGVRLALREGGCCASRAAYVGACLGAWLGPEAVPEHWLQQCLLMEELVGGAEAVCRSRDG